MRKVLTQKFFDRSTTKVARDLLGKFLVRRLPSCDDCSACARLPSCDDCSAGARLPKGEIAVMITEVEAYDGFADRASHAARGKTPRNAPMWGKAGAWYVYFVYGVHEMLNIVTREEEYPAAVLIRGVEGISGPGRLTKKLAIDRALNGKAARRASGLWIEDRGNRIPHGAISCAPRVGVSYAGEVWAKKPWRFVLRVPNAKIE